MFVLLITFVLFFVIIYIFYNLKNPLPIFGIYKKPGKWYPLKYVMFLCIFYYRRWRSRSDNSQTVSRAGHGAKSHNSPEEMDVAQPLSDHPKAFDAAFFIGANSDGHYLAIGCERRQLGTINGIFYLIVPGKGVLCSPKVPDTLLFGANVNTFGAEGILLTPLEPMKKWKISYNGKMRYQSEPSKLVNVIFQGEWIANSMYFDYDTDLDAGAVARSISRETWSKKYFEDLKMAHQSHYEQFGTMKVSVTIEDESFELSLDSFRDHSYGHKRDWSLMHRYAFHHIFLSDGHRVSVGVICQPCTASSFEVGVLYSPYNGGENFPIEWCDLELYQHGENGQAPTDYAFNFQAGGKIYTVQVNVKHVSEHFVGSQWEARMVERFAEFTVNGVKGWGVTEFHYNNKSGRPEMYSNDDPNWYKLMHN